MTQGLALKINLLAGLVGKVASVLERVAQSGHGKHAATIGHELAVHHGGARVVHGHVLHGLGIGDTGNDLAFLVAAGITRTRQDNGHGPLVTPVEFNLVELAVGTRPA